jgi:hypothetical protein
MQGLGYGFIMPVWTILHLLGSGTAAPRGSVLVKAIKIRHLGALETLPASLTFGYLLPTILMILPLSSNTLHQWLGGLWQGFPLWVALCQFILRKVADRHPTPPLSPTGSNNRRLLHRAYLIAFTLTSVSHLSTIGFLVARRLVPITFSSHLKDTLTFSAVFIPPYFQSPGTMRSMADGILNFFQYDHYVGATSALAWAMALRMNSANGTVTVKDWAILAGESFGVTLLAGPGEALVALLWNRDESILLEKELEKP